MKKLLIIPLMIVLVVGLVFSGCAAPTAPAPVTPTPAPTPSPAPTPVAPTPAPAKVFKLRRSDWGGVTESFIINGAKYCEEIERRTDGRVQITYYPASTLTGAAEAYDGVIGGISDMALLCMPYYPTRFPLLYALSIPGPIKDTAVGVRVYNELYYKFKPKEMDETTWMYVMYCADTHLYSVPHPVYTCDDLKDLKVRGTGISADLIKEMGGTPVAIPSPEIPDALQKGIINAHLCAGMQVQRDKIVPPLKYMTRCWGAVCGFLLVMNNDTWDSLPPDIQKVFKEVNEEFMYKDTEDFHLTAIEGEEWAIAHGLEVIESEEFMKCRDRAVDTIWDKYVADMEAKGLPGREFRDELWRLTELYQK